MKVAILLFHVWLIFIGLVASTPGAMPNPLRLPRKPPPPGQTYPNSPAFTPLQLSCNLVVPTTNGWKANRNDIAAFSRMHYDRFLYDPAYASFPLYLRDHFARDLAPSSLSCDSIGACGLTSCQVLNPELSQHDKQMAYYVFEQIFESQRIGMQEAATCIDGKMPELIRTYSAALRIQRQLPERLNDRRRNQKLAMAIVSGVGLVAGGAVGLPVFGFERTLIGPTTNMVTSTYISIVGTINAARREPERLTPDLEENLRWSLNEFRHAMTNNITNDMKTFMEGDPNKLEQDLIDILEGDYFFRRDENIQNAIFKMSEEMMFSSMINGAWAQERSYIVRADVPYGGCENDGRGLRQSRACLPEHPNSMYYIYALDVSREYDTWKNDQALIHGPTGYRNYIEGAKATLYGITKEDIGRSSIFVHENKLHDAIQSLDYPKVFRALELGKQLGKN